MVEVIINFVLEQQFYDLSVFVVIGRTDLLGYIDSAIDTLPQPSDPTQYRYSIVLLYDHVHVVLFMYINVVV